MEACGWREEGRCGTAREAQCTRRKEFGEGGSHARKLGVGEGEGKGQFWKQMLLQKKHTHTPSKV